MVTVNKVKDSSRLWKRLRCWDVPPYRTNSRITQSSSVSPFGREDERRWVRRTSFSVQDDDEVVAESEWSDISKSSRTFRVGKDDGDADCAAGEVGTEDKVVTMARVFAFPLCSLGLLFSELYSTNWRFLSSANATA